MISLPVWQPSSQASEIRSHGLNVFWQAPEQESYKVNTDASFLTSGNAGLGVIIRNFKGDVVAVFVFGPALSTSPIQAEALAILKGMEIVGELGLSKVVLESDCECLIKVLCKGDASLFLNSGYFGKNKSELVDL
uniref:RNase H type-1 domain-containing protein n=1 Tax=Nelumbo nucifera TaxID=4432 RepID=A0A822YJ16_NELNU|nr:TPA_asm: hypothetical protein HUJ06_009767 [Nelumbo nucifera]